MKKVKAEMLKGRGGGRRKTLRRKTDEIWRSKGLSLARVLTNAPDMAGTEYRNTDYQNTGQASCRPWSQRARMPENHSFGCHRCEICEGSFRNVEKKGGNGARVILGSEIRKTGYRTGVEVGLRIVPGWRGARDGAGHGVARGTGWIRCMAADRFRRSTGEFCGTHAFSTSGPARWLAHEMAQAVARP